MIQTLDNCHYRKDGVRRLSKFTSLEYFKSSFIQLLHILNPTRCVRPVSMLICTYFLSSQHMRAQFDLAESPLAKSLSKNVMTNSIGSS